MIFKQNKDSSVNFIRYKLKSATSNFKPLRKKPQKKINLCMDPQEGNPVYRHLRRERNNKHIINFILSAAPDLNSQQQSKFSPQYLRSKSFSPNFMAFAKNQKTQSSSQLKQFRSQGEVIFQHAGKMNIQLKQKKRKLGIINQYHSLFERYCDSVPSTKQSNDREMMIARVQLVKLCHQDIALKGKDLLKRASLMRNYQQPKINYKVLRRTSRVALTQATNKRNQGHSQNILHKNHTYSF